MKTNILNLKKSIINPYSISLNQNDIISLNPQKIFTKQKCEDIEFVYEILEKEKFIVSKILALNDKIHQKRINLISLKGNKFIFGGQEYLFHFDETKENLFNVIFYFRPSHPFMYGNFTMKNIFKHT